VPSTSSTALTGSALDDGAETAHRIDGGERSRLGQFCLAHFALAMQIGCPAGISPAAELNAKRGVGSFGRIARWYQAR
jgi:hypothetical protein